jgi:hypothetical protein
MDKPRVVFDCSEVRQLDSAGAELLLRCMEEVMKQDGDLKLASVSPQASVILKLTRIDRVFEIFESVSDAVVSFVGYAEALQFRPIPISSAPAPAEIRGTADLDMVG